MGVAENILRSRERGNAAMRLLRYFGEVLESLRFGRHEIPQECVGCQNFCTFS